MVMSSSFILPSVARAAGVLVVPAPAKARTRPPLGIVLAITWKDGGPCLCHTGFLKEDHGSSRPGMAGAGASIVWWVPSGGGETSAPSRWVSNSLRRRSRQGRRRRPLTAALRRCAQPCRATILATGRGGRSGPPAASSPCTPAPALPAGDERIEGGEGVGVSGLTGREREARHGGARILTPGRPRHRGVRVRARAGAARGRARGTATA